MAHYHTKALENDGTPFEVISKDQYRASTDRQVIKRCGGMIVSSKPCTGNEHQCRRAMLEHKR